MDAASVAARTSRYLAAPSVVGFEAPFFDVLEHELVSLGRVPQRRDGSLVTFGTTPGHLSAHIDRHGLVTLDAGTLGYAAAFEAGAHRTLRPAILGRVCDRFGLELVHAYDPVTGVRLAEGRVEHTDHCGIGPDLQLAVEGFDGLPHGTPVAFDHVCMLSDGRFSGQLDNATSAAIVMEALAAGFPGTAIFTAGEEAGRSWRGIVDALEPGRVSDLLVLDTSPLDEWEPVERGTVVLRHADAGAAFNADFVDRLHGVAAEEGLPVIWKDDVLAALGRPLGRTELGRVVAETCGDITGATLQVPTVDYHTNRETTSLAAIDAVLRALARIYGLGEGPSGVGRG